VFCRPVEQGIGVVTLPRSPGWKPGDTGPGNHPVIHATRRHVISRFEPAVHGEREGSLPGVPRLPPGAFWSVALGRRAIAGRDTPWLCLRPAKPAGAMDGAVIRAGASLRACFGLREARPEGEPSQVETHLGCVSDLPSLRGPWMALSFAPAHPFGPASAYARLARKASHRRSRHTLAVSPTCQACGGHGWPRRREIRRRAGGFAWCGARHGGGPDAWSRSASRRTRGAASLS